MHNEWIFYMRYIGVSLAFLGTIILFLVATKTCSDLVDRNFQVKYIRFSESDEFEGLLL